MSTGTGWGVEGNYVETHAPHAPVSIQSHLMPLCDVQQQMSNLVRGRGENAQTKGKGEGLGRGREGGRGRGGQGRGKSKAGGGEDLDSRTPCDRWGQA